MWFNIMICETDASFILSSEFAHTIFVEEDLIDAQSARMHIIHQYIKISGATHASFFPARLE